MTDQPRRDWKAEVEAIAHKLGIEHEPDTGSVVPGSLGAMLEQIEELKSRMDSETAEREACAAIADASEQTCKAEATRLRSDGENGDVMENQCASECRFIAREIRARGGK